MTAWNYAQIEVTEADMMVRPMIGPGDLTYEKARAEIRSLLTRLAAVAPQAKALVEAWDSGPRDDVVFWGPFTWAVYEHEPNDPEGGWQVWADDWIASRPEDVRRRINRMHRR